jgi:hypothetical protein
MLAPEEIINVARLEHDNEAGKWMIIGGNGSMSD